MAVIGEQRWPRRNIERLIADVADDADDRHPRSIWVWPDANAAADGVAFGKEASCRRLVDDPGLGARREVRRVVYAPGDQGMRSALK